MRELRYVILAIVLITSACSTSNVTNDFVSSPAPLPPLETLSSITSTLTPTAKSTHYQEPVLVTKFVFPSDYLEINDLYFTDDDTGWAVGRLDWYDDSISSIRCCKPIIFNTTDGGRNWKEIDAGIFSGILNSIVFVDWMTAYAVGQEYIYGIDPAFTPNTIILKTTDSGASWVQVGEKQMSGALLQVITTNDRNIWSVGFGLDGPQSLILRSADGLSWKVQKHPSEIGGKLIAVDFPSDKVGYAVGYIGLSDAAPYIIKTIDGGENWEVLSFPSIFGRLLDVAFLDESTGYVIGQFSETSSIAITNDGGESWTFKNLEPDIEPSWLTESSNRFVIIGNCWHLEACNNLIGLFDGNDFYSFETLALPTETITAVGNPMADGSIIFFTNTKPETWDAKYETTFYRYNVP